MRNSFFLTGALLLSSSCAPLRTSPHDEGHQWEVKWQEMQTQFDDLKQDVHCFQTELQILDEKIRYYENSLAHVKEEDLEKQKERLELLGKEVSLLNQKWGLGEKERGQKEENLMQLSTYAQETHLVLTQFKTRLQEIEQSIALQNRRFDELGKIKTQLEIVAKSLSSGEKTHKVKSGETLDKIAALHHVKVDRIKKLNDLGSDLIIVGQELKIPAE
ncbi:MAG: LysM peptidoglycan-binding domain-containing protein [Verrucomicrobiota bacterium]|nr:LysM peptidoglycan-binding domain-containing protein [Verrucomicrobiota bacterium]